MRSRFLAFSLAATLLAAGLAGAQAEPSKPTGDWLDAAVQVAFTTLTHADVAGDVKVHQVSLQGATRSAQELRGFYQQFQGHGQGEAFIATLQSALRTRLNDALSGLLKGATVTVSRADLDTASLSAPPGSDAWHPPVGFRFAATLDESLASLGLASEEVALDEDKLRAVLDLGAVATLPYTLTAQPGWDLALAFTAPPWVELSDATGGRLAPDGSAATWELRNARAASPMRLPASLTVRSRDAPETTATDARVDLALSMDDISGLTLPGALSGDFGKVDARFDATVRARSLRIADFPSLRDAAVARLPSAVKLEGLTADGLRQAVAQGLVTSEDLRRVEDTFRGMAEERIRGFGADAVKVEGGFAAGSLDPSGVSRPLDGEPPLVYKMSAGFRVPLSLGGAGRVSAAANLVQRPITFPLPRLQGLDTSYKITLPPGIALVDVEPQGATAERGREGGRDYVVVTPQGDDASATFILAVTSDFVISKFWYVWAGLALLTVLSVALLMWRRRRKRRAKLAPVEPEPPRAAPAPVAPTPTGSEPGAERARG